MRVGAEVGQVEHRQLAAAKAATVSAAQTLESQHAGQGAGGAAVSVVRAHPWLGWMAKDLGFLLHTTRRQFATLPHKMSPKLFEELRTDLSLADLTLVTEDSLPSIQQFFRETIIKQAARAAPRW